MGFLDVISGRSKRPKNNLDALFALPNAAITLQVSLNFQMTGMGSVCFRAAEGPAFAQTMTDVVALLDNDDDPDVEQSKDDYGFTWLMAQQDDMSALVTDLPTRVQQGDLSASDARSLLMRLLADAEPDAMRREARLGDTMARIEAASRAAAQALADSGKAVLPVGSPAAGTTSPAR